MVAALMLAALMLFTNNWSEARTASEVHVHVSVTITGHIEGIDEQTLVTAAEHALEAAHIIAEHHAGADIVELHIEVHTNPDHHFHLAGHGGEWSEEENADIVDHIDDVLIEMIHHFIDKVHH